MRGRIALLTLVLVALAAFGSASAQTFELVVHPDSTVTSISKAELSKIFLKRLRTWEDGTPARPVDQQPSNDVRRAFTRTVHGRSIVNVEIYWKRRVFSGTDVPPDEMVDDSAVLDYVRMTPGAVGYVRRSAPLDGVRRLTLED